MVQAQSPKIQDTYTIYKLDATARRVTAATLRTYDDRIVPFIKWCEGQNKPFLTDVTATLLRSYLVSLQERELSSYRREIISCTVIGSSLRRNFVSSLGVLL